MSANGELKFKIPPIRIASDDCEVMVGRVIVDGQIMEEGEPHRVHEGEWVEILPVTSMRAWLGLGGAATDDEEADASLRASAIAANFGDICSSLAKQVTAWTWTDMVGDPLPQPFRNIEAIKDLATDEVIWLMNAAAREGTDELKNDDAPSQNGSGRAARSRRKSSSGASARRSTAPPAKP